MMIRRTLFISVVLSVMASMAAKADDDKKKMLEAGEKWLKLYIKNNPMNLSIDIPDQYKIDVPDGMHLDIKKFGYTWSDYDVWTNPLDPMDKLRWKQDIDGGHRQLEITDDGFYFSLKKSF